MTYRRVDGGAHRARRRFNWDDGPIYPRAGALATGSTLIMTGVLMGLLVAFGWTLLTGLLGIATITSAVASALLLLPARTAAGP